MVRNKKLALILVVVLLLGMVPINLSASQNEYQPTAVVPIEQGVVAFTTPGALHLEVTGSPILGGTVGVVALLIGGDIDDTNAHTWIEIEGDWIPAQFPSGIDSWGISGGLAGDRLTNRIWDSEGRVSPFQDLLIDTDTAERTITITTTYGELTTYVELTVDATQTAVLTEVQVLAFSFAAPGTELLLNTAAFDQNGMRLSPSIRDFTWSISSIPAANDTITLVPWGDAEGDIVLRIAPTTVARTITVTATLDGISGIHTITVDPIWPTMRPGQQTGILYVGEPGEATVTFVTTNLPAGTHFVTVETSAHGVSIEGFNRIAPSRYNGYVTIDGNGVITLPVKVDATLPFAAWVWIGLSGQLNDGRWFSLFDSIWLEFQHVPTSIDIWPDTSISVVPGTGHFSITAEVRDHISNLMWDEPLTWEVDLGGVSGVTYSIAQHQIIDFYVSQNATVGVITVTVRSVSRPTVYEVVTITIDPEVVRFGTAITFIWSRGGPIISGDIITFTAIVIDQFGIPMHNEPVAGWELHTLIDGVNVPQNIDTLVVNGNTATLTISSNTTERHVTVSTISVNYGAWGWPVWLHTNGSAPTFRIGNQVGTATSGTAGSISFSITSQNIPAGSYQAEIWWLPSGVTVEGWQNNQYLSTGQVMIDANGNATLNLAVAATAAAATSRTAILGIISGREDGLALRGELLRITINPRPDDPDPGDNGGGQIPQPPETPPTQPTTPTFPQHVPRPPAQRVVTAEANVRVSSVTLSRLTAAQRNSVLAGSELFQITKPNSLRDVPQRVSVNIGANTPEFVRIINADGTYNCIDFTIVGDRVYFSVTGNSIVAITFSSDATPPVEANIILPAPAPLLSPPLASTQVMRLTIGNTEFNHMGTLLQNDVAPFVDPAYDRTMVPLRIIAEALGAEVDFNEITRTVSIVQNGVELTLAIDVPLPGGFGTPVIQNDRTFVPARYVMEVFNATVRWDEATQAVYVYIS